MSVYEKLEKHQGESPKLSVFDKISLFGACLSILFLLFSIYQMILAQWEHVETGVLHYGGSERLVIIASACLWIVMSSYLAYHDIRQDRQITSKIPSLEAGENDIFIIARNLLKSFIGTFFLVLTLLVMSQLVTPGDRDFLEARIVILEESYDNVSPVENKDGKAFNADKDGKHYILHLDTEGNDLMIVKEEETKPTAEYEPVKIN